MNIVRAYLSLVLGHGGGVRPSLDSSVALCRCERGILRWEERWASPECLIEEEERAKVGDLCPLKSCPLTNQAQRGFKVAIGA